jgi:hypothetical protein
VSRYVSFTDVPTIIVWLSSRSLSGNAELKQGIDEQVKNKDTSLALPLAGAGPVRLQPSAYELARQVYAQVPVKGKSELKTLLRAAFVHHGVNASIPELAKDDYKVLLAYLVGGIGVNEVYKLAPSKPLAVLISIYMSLCFSTRLFLYFFSSFALYTDI